MRCKFVLNWDNIDRDKIRWKYLHLEDSLEASDNITTIEGSTLGPWNKTEK